MNFSNLVTIIIPTFNRYEYLKRILTYYNSFGYRLNILIADSSTMKMDKGDLKKFLEQHNVTYIKFPGDINMYKKCSEALKRIKSKYVVFCADDDFIIPDSIIQSVNFLEKNPDFAVCLGLTIRFVARIGKGKKEFLCNGPSRLTPSIISEIPEERLKFHLANYAPNFYGVRRTDLLRLIFEKDMKIATLDRFSEVLLSAIMAIHGKVKFLDVLYAVREGIANSSGVRSKALGDFIKEGTYDEKYIKFRDCLSKHLVKESQLTIEESKKVIDDAMSVYLSACARNKEPAKNILVRKIRNILLDLRLPDWLYAEIRSLYRKWFLSKLSRMGDFRSFADTLFSKHYDEINKIYKYLLSYSKSDRR